MNLVPANAVIATEISANQFGRIHLDLGAYELPRGIDVGTGPSDLKVIDIDHQEAFKLGVPITPVPSFGSTMKIELFNLRIEVLLPDPPRIGVAIKRHFERHNWATIPGFARIPVGNDCRGTLGATLAMFRAVKLGPASQR